jgi:acetyltransferase
MSLAGFFTPESVAVVGASRRKGKVGHEIVCSLLRGGFEGRIFPVNPNAETVEGLRCYPSLDVIGEVPDLVVVVVPARMVAEVIQVCGRIGAKHVIVVSGGFTETGEAGRRLERQIAQLARNAGIRMIGPNCLGIMVPGHKLNASFAGVLPEPGQIGYFSQSGSLMAAIVDMARARGIGFSKLISIGNKADVDELDVLRALADDDQTEVIAGYLETITNGDAFIREAERIARRKPILLMKAGQTRAGARAASSHTGRLADQQRAYEIVFERAGVIRCQSVTAQFDYARALATQPLPAGHGVAIVANAGGPGIMAADATERHGLELASFTGETIGRLAAKLPAHANVQNPVDVLGDALADRFEHALSVVLDDPRVHAAIVLLTPHAMTECSATAEAVVRVARAKRDKTLLACFLGSSLVAEAIDILRAGGVPCYGSPEFAVVTLKVMADYHRWRHRPKRVVKLFPVNRRKVEKILTRHLRDGSGEIGETEAKEMLEAYGFVTPRGLVATTGEQAASFAEQIGYPVALKIWSPDIVHKTDVGGVRTGLSGPQEVMDAFDLMMYRIPKRAPKAHILGVLVQEMCTKGREVILGMHRDPHYGPLMMFGMGGVLVEVLRDVAFHLAPLTGEEAKEMLVNTRTYQLLTGARGAEAVDIDAIAEGLQRLSQLATEFPRIQEVDINPYVVGPEGTTPVAADARIRVGEKPEG